MNIIQRNFFRLLRSGAFDDKEPVEPMSPFKWRRLFQMVMAQRVVPVFAKGVANHDGDAGLNLPADLINSIAEAQKSDDLGSEVITEEELHFSSKRLNRRMKRIINKELKDNDEMSVETVDLLELIIFNVYHILNKGLSMDGIIRLGRYLRIRGDKVDFVKLDQWLAQLSLQRMAQLQGSILIEVFGFEQDEVPFVVTKEKDAYSLTILSISNLAKDTAEDWHFRQSRTGFVRNNSTVLRRNVGRSIRFYNYAPWETTSSFFRNLGRSLSEIEE